MPTKCREKKSTAVMAVFFKLLDSQPKLEQWFFLATLGIRNKDMRTIEKRSSILRMRNINDLIQ